jgi:TatA/E family protein of Tat protein translocase
MASARFSQFVTRIYQVRNAMIVDMDARILGNDRGLQSVWSIVMNILAFGIENLGGEDLLLIPLIVLFLFGAKKLPDLARILGESMNEFRKAREDIDRKLPKAAAQPPPCHSTQQVASGPNIH